MGTRGSSIIPTLRYKDAAAAVRWLGEAFGFEEHLLVPSEGGGVTHAQLTWGDAMVMLSDARNDEFGGHQAPAEPSRKVTQSPYLIVPDIQAHYRRAVAAGADVVMDLEEQEYGGKFYSCRDPEGHLWNFGQYDPWADPEDAAR